MAAADVPRREPHHRTGDGPAGGSPAAPGRWLLAATILGSSMVFIDGSAVGITLPTLQVELDASAADAQWVVQAYALTLAALILVGGSLGDHFGRKRIFMIGTALFAASSVACGLAPNVATLIGARAAQGVAGALLTPASLAIINASYEGERARGRAIGTWSGATALTAAFGPVLGGWLVESFSWRWVFVINLPLAVAVLLVAWRGVPESRDPAAGRLDVAGATLGTLGLGGLAYGLIEGPARGWSEASVLAGLTIGLAALAAFVVVELRHSSPMVPPRLFRSRTFTGANLLTFLLYGAFGGALYFLPFNLIQVQGYSSAAAGAVLLPTTLILFGLSRWTGGLVGAVGARLPLVAGPLVVAAALVILAWTGIGGGYWTTWFPPAVVLGIGLAVTVPALTTTVLGAAPRTESGIASGINNAVSRTANVVAVAVFGILVAAVFDRALDVRLAGLDLPAELRTVVDARRGDLGALDVSDRADAATATSVAAAVDAAFVAGFRLAMLVGAVMAALAAGAAWWLVAGKETAPNAGVRSDPAEP